VDDTGRCTYDELAARVRRFAGALRAAGVAPEQRVLLCLEDSIDFAVAFLGAIWAGVVPVPVNTLLPAADYALMIRHSRARLLFVSPDQYDVVHSAAPDDVPVIVLDANGLSRFAGSADPLLVPYDSCASDICFWLYSSGSTGEPKAAVHLHRSLCYTADHYAVGVLGLRAGDVVYSASKLFFAYGLGNALTFPLSVGATAVLTRHRVTPDVAFTQLVRQRATIFCAVPTLFASMLAWPDAPSAEPLAVRLCVSAGEALPRDIGERWKARYGSDILDGIGSTEMLHIFLSNRPGDVRYGTTGRPVPGYELRLVDDDGHAVAAGELGDLYVKGGSSAAMYWADRERSCATFQGAWTRTGDKFRCDADGSYVYGGRSDDMLKVGGMYVSPFEVESALVAHPAVLEAAVVGAPDAAGLTKPRAFVVLRVPCAEAEMPAVRDTLRAHVKARLAHYKCPHWIEVVAELPKTATGKVQRFRLREQR
jgi:benzoate-CoA ligase